jgi:hypothetical protein
MAFGKTLEIGRSVLHISLNVKSKTLSEGRRGRLSLLSHSMTTKKKRTSSRRALENLKECFKPKRKNIR